MTTKEKARAYDKAIEKIKYVMEHGVSPVLNKEDLQDIFPELAESEGERIRKALIEYFTTSDNNSYYAVCGVATKKILAWLEKQGNKDTQVLLPTFTFDDILALQCCMETTKKVQEDKDLYEKLNDLHGRVYDAYQLEKQGDNCLVNFDEAEKEKYDFVSGQYIQCRASFNEFKEDNSYWLEYIGNDTYIGRSDNILNQKFHITPRQLYRLFTQQHFLKEDNTNDETNGPTGYGKYVDECLNEASKHFFSEGEDKYSVADLFYAGVRCGKSWFEKQGEQKPVDVVEPKFRVGDWITDGQLTCKVLGITGKSYELHLQNDDYCHFETDIQSVNKYYHLWTIQDAKDGDVLASKDKLNILIFRNLDTSITFSSYYNIAGKGELGWSNNCFIPATKEQRELLFQEIRKAGYEWDDEKKEVKKIEEEYDGEDYGIDGLWHAQRILEKTLGKVDGYQSDDGILEHKCAISAVKKLYAQKPVEWSEEDKKMYLSIIEYTYQEMPLNNKQIAWLVSVKQRIKK